MYEKKELHGRRMIHKGFKVEDPFNQQNTLEGNIIIGPGKYYGALNIKIINGKEVSDVVDYATPKLEYPFSKGFNYKFPSASELKTFRKYDGTNVFMHRYYVRGGGRFTSYKVRLWPFLRGKFLPLWNEILEMHPSIPDLYDMNPDLLLSGFAFEMYGGRNPHLMRYSNPLDAVVLFAVTLKGEVIPPHLLETGDVPKAEFIKDITKDYVFNYEQDQAEFGRGLTVVSQEDDDFIQFSGEEGAVWYLREKETGLWRMFKCKPAEILKIHWEASTIEQATCQMTAQNVLESEDTATVENVSALLQEEFSKKAIASSLIRIKKAVDVVNGNAELDKRIVDALKAHIETGGGLYSTFSRDSNVPDVMRILSKSFDRGDMKAVYQRFMLMRGGK